MPDKDHNPARTPESLRVKLDIGKEMDMSEMSSHFEMPVEQTIGKYCDKDDNIT